MYVKHKDKKNIQSSGPGQVDFPAEEVTFNAHLHTGQESKQVTF